MIRRILAVLLTAAFAGSSLAAGIASHDASQPIDIAADRLQVEQEQEKATFIGNVDVKQADITLKADQLTVFYALGSEQASAQAISRIEAVGNVIIISPEETASGDRGTYDLLSETMNLEGNVVLTRAENVIRGGRLDIDLKTNVATMQGTGGEDASGRVRALFVPAQNN